MSRDKRADSKIAAERFLELARKLETEDHLDSGAITDALFGLAFRVALAVGPRENVATWLERQAAKIRAGETPAAKSDATK